MRRPILAAALAALVAAPAPALTVNDFTDDRVFNDICFEGTSPQDCEFAVGEIRGGNGDDGGDWEVAIQNPPGSPVDKKNLAWTNGATYGFTFSYSQGSGDLALSVTGPEGTGVTSSTSLGADGLAEMNRLFIRTRSDGPEDRIEFFDLELDGQSIGNLTYRGPGSANAAYLDITGFDFSGDWRLAGDVVLTWSGDAIPLRSALDANFKLTETTSTVPLPAAGWMLLGGLGAIGVLASRRRG